MSEEEFIRYRNFMAQSHAQSAQWAQEAKAAQKELTIKLKRLNQTIAQVKRRIDRWPPPRVKRVTALDKQIQDVLELLKRCRSEGDGPGPDAAPPDEK